jgi:adenosine deaminase
MPPITPELLRRLPKAELHCHLDGSVRPETLLELGRAYRLPMPRDDAEALRDYMRVDDAQSLEDYLARFDVTLSVMQTAEALERIAYELAVDAARDGVRYIEVRYCPLLNVKAGLSLEQALEAPLRGLERAGREGGAMARVIVCALRHLEPRTSVELARLAVAYKDRGVVAFDLAGGELGFPASAHAAAFLYAREHDLPCTCHAGEGADASYVRDAVHVCAVHRIGHATRLIEDQSLTQFVNDRRIPLEICLTSNVQTKAVESYETHPLRAYYDRGMNVVLNTDNRLMSGTTLTDEYLHAARHFDFTLDDLARIALNGFESSFLPWAEREALVGAVRRDLATLGARVAA